MSFSSKELALVGVFRFIGGDGGPLVSGPVCKVTVLDFALVDPADGMGWNAKTCQRDAGGHRVMFQFGGALGGGKNAGVLGPFFHRFFHLALQWRREKLLLPLCFDMEFSKL